MSNHPDPNLILDYLEGDLTPRKAAEFERLLNEDRELRRLLEQLASDRRTMRQLPQEQAPPQLMDHVHQRLERQMLLKPSGADEDRRVTTRRFRLGQWAAYGSLAAMLVFSALTIFQVLDPEETVAPLISDRDNLLARIPEEADKQTPDVADEPASLPVEKIADTGLFSEEMDEQPAIKTDRIEGDFARLTQLALAEPAKTNGMPPMTRAGRSRSHPMLQNIANARLNVEADDPAIAQQEVRKWAVHHNAKVIDNRPRSDDELHAGDIAKNARETAQNELVLVIQGNQLPQLIDHLSQSDTLSVDIEPVPAARQYDLAETASSPSPDKSKLGKGGAGGSLAKQQRGSEVERQAILEAPQQRGQPRSERAASIAALGKDREAIERKQASAVDIRWGRVLEEQLPLSPYAPVYNDTVQVTLLVRIQARVLRNTVIRKPRNETQLKSNEQATLDLDEPADPAADQAK